MPGSPRPPRSGNGWFGFLRAFVKSDREQRGTLPNLTAKRILAWADAHHARTGRWPTCRSGSIPEAPGETWLAVEAALCWGLRGLPPGSTLTRFLAEQRGKRNRLNPPPLSVSQILRWADAIHRRTGRWPQSDSGTIDANSGLLWATVDKLLRDGRCGLPGGSSLARLLAARRGVPNRADRPRLTYRQILAWADAYYRRTGSWPNDESGPIAGVPGETWSTVDTALREGKRSLPGGCSLVQLLVARRSVRNRHYLPPLTVPQILAWADAFHKRTGRWPTARSGPIPGAGGETWLAVHEALYEGLRGLPGGSSLARLLEQHRGVRNIHALPPPTERKILRWARAHRRRNGAWPTGRSGPVLDAPGETWANVTQALYKGLRGLPGGSSVAQLLREHGHG
jgi:hypothetical protein